MTCCIIFRSIRLHRIIFKLRWHTFITLSYKPISSKFFHLPKEMGQVHIAKYFKPISLNPYSEFWSLCVRLFRSELGSLCLHWNCQIGKSNQRAIQIFFHHPFFFFLLQQSNNAFLTLMLKLRRRRSLFQYEASVFRPIYFSQRFLFCSSCYC